MWVQLITQGNKAVSGERENCPSGFLQLWEPWHQPEQGGLGVRTQGRWVWVSVPGRTGTGDSGACWQHCSPVSLAELLSFTTWSHLADSNQILACPKQVSRQVLWHADVFPCLFSVMECVLLLGRCLAHHMKINASQSCFNWQNVVGSHLCWFPS